jgi:transposase
MIQLTAETPILIATQAADFRCGIDGFAALCKKRLAQDPRSGTVFVFINRNKTMIRALSYDGTGFWLMTKRLSEGSFKRWPKSHEKMNAMTAIELRAILTGNDG